MRLGLPSSVRACLFDLDGVLTPTAKVHAQRGSRCSTPTCAHAPERRARRSCRSTRSPTTSGTSTASRARTARARSSPLGASGFPKDARTTRRKPRRCAASGTARTRSVMRLLREKGVAPYAGSVRYVRAVRDGGLLTAVVSSSRNCRQVLASAGIAELFDAIVDGVVARELNLAGKPAPDTYLAAARRLGVRRRAVGRLRGCAGRRRGGPRRRFRLRRRSRPRRPDGRSCSGTARASS